MGRPISVTSEMSTNKAKGCKHLQAKTTPVANSGDVSDASPLLPTDTSGDVDLLLERVISNLKRKMGMLASELWIEKRLILRVAWLSRRPFSKPERSQVG